MAISRYFPLRRAFKHYKSRFMHSLEYQLIIAHCQSGPEKWAKLWALSHSRQMGLFLVHWIIVTVFVTLENLLRDAAQCFLVGTIERKSIVTKCTNILCSNFAHLLLYKSFLSLEWCRVVRKKAPWTKEVAIICQFVRT